MLHVCFFPPDGWIGVGGQTLLVRERNIVVNGKCAFVFVPYDTAVEWPALLYAPCRSRRDRAGL